MSGRVGFTQPRISERERLKRLHVKSGGKLACAEGHRIELPNIYRFDNQRLCKMCVESGAIKPVPKRWVYFIADEYGNVKIGIAADVQARLDNLQSANASELTVLASMPGGRELERELHQEFSAHRVRGEWFRLVPEIRDYIASVSEPMPEKPGKVPEWVRIQRELIAKQGVV